MIKFTPCKSSMMILYIVGDKTYYNIHIILIPSYDFHYFKRAALFLWNKFFLKSTASFLVSKRLFMCLLQHIQLHGIPIYRLQFSLHSYFQHPFLSKLRSFCFHVECICFSKNLHFLFFHRWHTIFVSNCVTYCVILAKNTTNLLLMERNQANIYDKQKNLGKSEIE